VSSFPTLEPAVVERGTFLIEHLLDRHGRVEVGVGDVVTPETVIARTESSEKPVTLYVASELGVPNDKVVRQLTKSVGATFEAGEDIARRRHGLRTASVPAPFAGTLTRVDESTGTVEFVVSSAPDELRALVNGEVERIFPDHGAVIRATGARVYGIVGFGGVAVGRLVAALDRHDRELTADQVRDGWRGAIVLAGMTLSVPALNKLRQVGVAGVIVGSVAEAEIRRFLTTDAGVGERGAAGFWCSPDVSAPFPPVTRQAPFAIVVTEGFGRIPMAEPVFNFLRGHDGKVVSLRAETSVGEHLSRPEIYIASAPDASDPGRATAELAPNRIVRLVGGKDSLSVGTLLTAELERLSFDGVRTGVVTLKRADGSEDTVSVANVEVLI